MKKHLALLALLTLGGLTPASAAEPAVPATPAQATAPAATTIPVDPSLTPAEQKAVRSYIIASLRASVKATVEQSSKGALSMKEAFRIGLEAEKSIPRENLPAHYQAYLREAHALGQELVDTIQGADKPVHQMTPQDYELMQQSMQTIGKKGQELDARHPKAAPYIGGKLIEKLAQKLFAGANIEQKLTHLILLHAKEFQGDEQKLRQWVSQQTYQLMMETIDKLEAE